jgi:hypothetical protein
VARDGSTGEEIGHQSDRRTAQNAEDAESRTRAKPLTAENAERDSSKTPFHCRGHLICEQGTNRCEWLLTEERTARRMWDHIAPANNFWSPLANVNQEEQR